MAFRVLMLSWAVMILVLHTQLHAEQPAELEQRVNQAINKLDSDQFDVRVAATQTLKNIGQPAIAPLTAAALEGELETTDRALQILISFYRLEDEAALEELDTALEKLLDSDHPSAARRAASAIKLHAEDREQRALKKLEQLNAMIRSPEPIPGMIGDSRTPQHIWIDDQWLGGDAELKQFRRLKTLLQLYRVEGCPASLDAVRKLEQLMPGLAVQERGAACLGLGQGEAQDKGFIIQNVSEGGSIHSAGLRKNDVIIGFAGLKVDNFFQLVELIKKHEVGATVKVVYLREGNKRFAEVTLKSWREVFDAEEAAKKAKIERQQSIQQSQQQQKPQPGVPQPQPPQQIPKPA